MVPRLTQGTRDFGRLTIPAILVVVFIDRRQGFASAQVSAVKVRRLAHNLIRQYSVGLVAHGPGTRDWTGLVGNYYRETYTGQS